MPNIIKNDLEPLKKAIQFFKEDLFSDYKPPFNLRSEK
jgi:hypothetical protein